MRKKLEGGSNLFGGWDIVRVLHAYDDPPNVLRCLHGSVGTLESSDDRKQGLSSIDPVLDVLIEEVFARKSLLMLLYSLSICHRRL